jgi:hypothetical protein
MRDLSRQVGILALKVDHNSEILNVLVNRTGSGIMQNQNDQQFPDIKSSLPADSLEDFNQLDDKIKQSLEAKQFLVSLVKIQ